LSCTKRNFTSGVNALRSTKSSKFLIQLQQHQFYAFDPKQQRFVKIDQTLHDKSKRVALLFFSNSDQFYHLSASELEQLKHLEDHEIVVCRWSEPGRLEEMMEKTQDYISGKRPATKRDQPEELELQEMSSAHVHAQSTPQRATDQKINKLIFMGHGDPEHIQGGRPLTNCFGATRFDEETLSEEAYRKRMTEDGEIILFSCSTGTPGGLAQRLSRKTDKTNYCCN